VYMVNFDAKKLRRSSEDAEVAQHASRISGTSGCRGRPQIVPFDSPNVMIFYSCFILIYRVACAVSEILAAKLQNFTFSIFHWSSLVEFGITGYYYQGQFRRMGSQDTELSYHKPISTFCCTVQSQCTRLQTDRQTDRQTDVMLVA